MIMPRPEEPVIFVDPFHEDRLKRAREVLPDDDADLVKKAKADDENLAPQEARHDQAGEDYNVFSDV